MRFLILSTNEKVLAGYGYISTLCSQKIMSFGTQNNWGDKKLQAISTLLSKLIIIDINSGDPDLLKAYAEIDAFSKGRLPGHPLGNSAITMGKNDLWIAATARVANAILITVDSDFSHLANKFIQVKKY